MEKEKIKKIILDQKHKISKEVFIEREKLALLSNLMKDPFIIIISGIRRCGKSTLLNYLRKIEPQSDYYLNFDDNRLNDFSIDDFEKLYEAFIELFGVQKSFFFDEIQEIQGFEKFLRRLHNEGKKVVITGSNATMLSKELGTHLTGRHIQIELYPFSFKEFLALKKIKIERDDFYITHRSIKIKKLFYKYIQKGGFPEYLKTSNSYFLSSIYQNILYRDIVSRYNLSKVKTFKDAAFYLISNIACEMSFHSIKNFLGLKSPVTVKEYLSYLENSYLLFSINKFDYSLKKQIVNPKKIYTIDTGLANSISFKFSENYGNQLENIVFIELKRREFNIYYHKQKKECDFVIKEKDKITKAIQVSKSLENEDTRKREIDGLIEAMKIYNLKIGYILTDDEDEEIKIEDLNIIVKPVWKWLLESNRLNISIF